MQLAAVHVRQCVAHQTVHVARAPGHERKAREDQHNKTSEAAERPFPKSVHAFLPWSGSVSTRPRTIPLSVKPLHSVYLLCLLLFDRRPSRSFWYRASARSITVTAAYAGRMSSTSTFFPSSCL